MVMPWLVNLTIHHFLVKLQLITCHMLEMTDENNLLQFNDFLNDCCGKCVIIIAKQEVKVI